MPALILFVSIDPEARHCAEAMLSDTGHLVAVSSSFVAARKLLHSITPDLLVADVSIKTGSGLRFAIRSRREQPDLPVIIAHPAPDAAMKADAQKHGASLVEAPLDSSEFRQLVLSLLSANRRMGVPPRRWRRKHVTDTLEVKAGDVPAQIVDMSYGGVRLAFHDRPNLPRVFDITVTSANITVRAHRVWTREAAGGQFWCGVELEQVAAPPWSDFVDLLWLGRATP